MYTHINPQSL